MPRQLTAYFVFALIMFLLLWWPVSEWRQSFQEYYTIRTRQASLPQAMENEPDISSTSGMKPPAQIYDLIVSGNINMRLDRIADSISNIQQELSVYHEALIQARETVRGLQPGRTEDFSKNYFVAVRSLSRLENEARNFNQAVDSLKTDIEAVKALDHQADGKHVVAVAAIRWVTPDMVQVREACISCHLPLNENGEVLLFPEKEQQNYPLMMSQHPLNDFGCTVCHFGRPGALEIASAHGTDESGRPFRAGKLAFRSCGLCHAELSPIRYEFVDFTWPSACARCHEGESLVSLIDSSSVAAFQHPLDSNTLRAWLLKHWSGKAGVMPQRKQFEEVIALIVSGNVEGEPVMTEKNFTAGTASESGLLRCEKCGRTFKAAAKDNANYVCPVDGANLRWVKE